MRKIVYMLCACVLVACAPGDSRTEFQLGAATLGGAYFPIGQGIANLVTQHAEELTMVPIVTRGAIENPRLVSVGDIEVGMTNADLAYFGFHGQPPYETELGILAAGALHPSMLHLVIQEDSDIRTMADLRGRRVALGPAGGTTVAFARLLLDAYDMTFDDIVPSFLSYTDGFSQLGDGNVDAAFALAGIPAAAVMQTRATQELRFITIEPEVFEEIIEANPYYYTMTVPASLYNTAADAVVLAVDNILVVGNEQSDDTVFEIVNAVYGNLDELRSTNAIAQQINPEQSLRLPIPLHPGAARFFEQP
ncbi:MAG: TAXI family TRAP transporter solute-binding subunit [Candidatus Rariloculaceae bacterium]